MGPNRQEHWTEGDVFANGIHQHYYEGHIVKRVRKATLFLCLRQHRHKLLDEEFKQAAQDATVRKFG